MKANSFSPNSLLIYFKPPEGFTALFGCLCGYTADIDFLKKASEVFSGGVPKTVQLLLMLDKRQKQIRRIEVPAVYAPQTKQSDVPFYIMHAKLALLIFRNRDSDNYCIRLLVSTGNWTMQTLSNSLDVVVALDYFSDDTKRIDARQNRADIIAAWSMLKWLQQFYKLDFLTAYENESKLFYKQFCQKLDGLSNHRKVVTRFFDNRRQSFVQQIPELLKKHNQLKTRNYLCIGAGFYEKMSDAENIPTVIKKLMDNLEQALLSKTAEKDLFVNPETYGSISRCASELKERGFCIRAATDPEKANRQLHAKFIVSFNFRDTSPKCTSTWIYVGSGNITPAGFTNSISAKGGNLEAGIIIFPEKLNWENRKNIAPHELVTNLLPIDWSDDNIDPDAVNSDNGTEIPDVEFIAPPIDWFEWRKSDREQILIPMQEEGSDYRVIGIDGKTCKKLQGSWLWTGSQPLEVKVKWTNRKQNESWVPVLDQHGMSASITAQTLTLEEVFWQLSSFPDFPPDDNDLVFEDELELTDTATATQKKTQYKTGKYPIRIMMELLEQIAEKQIQTKPYNWKFWCSRLKSTFLKAEQDDNVLDVFRKMKMNPFSPLRQKPFRPEYAEDNSTDDGKEYEKIICEIEEHLEFKNLKPL